MSNYRTSQLIGLILGPVLFFLILILPTPADMSPSALRVAAIAVLMATWWISEAIPIPATALLPIALFPVLGVMKGSAVTTSYANHLIYLFMGGFLIAVAMEKWNLHRRIALRTIKLVGVTPDRIVLGFMLATAFLSMWISNTATTMMMITIALAVIRQSGKLLQAHGTETTPRHFNFGIKLTLGIAYAASIGGVATLIGTPPNAILAGVMEKTYGISISFADWMSFALPLSLVMLALTWLYLTRIGFPREIDILPGGKQTINDELAKLGRMSREEKWVLAVFVSVAAAWILRGVVNIDELKMVKDSTIAIIGALLLFIIPSNLKRAEFLLDWETAVKIPWDIIILFGGGFALASGFSESGLTQWLASQLTVLQGIPILLIIFVVVALVLLLTEITSNTATASLFLPVMGAFALGMQIHPAGLMIAAALSASFAFMLPVATPPNAIAFSTRQVTIAQMVKTGIWLNLIGCFLITLFVTYLLPYLWGIDLLRVPPNLIPTP